MNSITQQQFAEYRGIQDLGIYNMLDPRARELTNLNRTQWIEIIENYEALLERYPDCDENE